MTNRGRPKVILTAGGTREPIDDVRAIRNVGTGSLPSAMAEALLARGWEVHYLHGPGAVLPGELLARFSLLDGDEVGLDGRLEALASLLRRRRTALSDGALTLHPVGSAQEANDTLRSLLPRVRPQLVACAMAVADWSPKQIQGKMSSKLPTGAATVQLTLHPTPKVIDAVREIWPEAQLLGFKLLSDASESEHRQATAHLAQRSGATWVFDNDMIDYRQGRRRGVLRGRLGEALEPLDGGAGKDAGERLAEKIVEAVLRRLEL